jgi:hypothetical protein
LIKNSINKNFTIFFRCTENIVFLLFSKFDNPSLFSHQISSFFFLADIDSDTFSYYFFAVIKMETFSIIKNVFHKIRKLIKIVLFETISGKIEKNFDQGKSH